MASVTYFVCVGDSSDLLKGLLGTVMRATAAPTEGVPGCWVPLRVPVVPPTSVRYQAPWAEPISPSWVGPLRQGNRGALPKGGALHESATLAPGKRSWVRHTGEPSRVT